MAKPKVLVKKHPAASLGSLEQQFVKWLSSFHMLKNLFTVQYLVTDDCDSSTPNQDC